MAEDCTSNIIIKSEDDVTDSYDEGSVGSESSAENVPLKKQKLANGEPTFTVKQESCSSDEVNGNSTEDANNTLEENENGGPNSTSDNSQTLENETSFNRLLRKILNEKKKELLNHPEIVEIFTPK